MEKTLSWHEMLKHTGIYRSVPTTDYYVYVQTDDVWDDEGTTVGEEFKSAYLINIGTKKLYPFPTIIIG